MNRLYQLMTCILTGLLLLWSSAALALLAEVPKTGQTTTYAAGDDGALQKGVAWSIPRFTDNANVTVTDNLTGLIWLKNANCLDTVGGVAKGDGYLKWEDALVWTTNLVSGFCSLTDGSSVGDWRLPSRKELQSLVDVSQGGPALPTDHPFTGVQANGYWSSSSNAYNTDTAWGVDMNGNVSYGDKTTASYVWPVRGGLFGASAISVLPTAKNFEPLATGGSASQTVTIANGSSATSRLQINAVTLRGADAGQFGVNFGDGTAGTCGVTPILAPGASCTVSLSFSPTTDGAKSGTLRVSGSDVTAPNVDVPLAGTSTSLLVNGACGSASGTKVPVAPSTNLCTDGAPTAVTGSGPWNWDCAGLNGGSTASCSAPVGAVSADIPKTIADNATVASAITYPAAACTAVTDLNVTVDITHTYVSDLDIYLIHTPSGKTVQLFNRSCDETANLTATFDDQAAGPVQCPVNGTYKPVDLLSDFNGIDAAGTWTLSVTDNSAYDTGTLNGWSIALQCGTNPVNGTCGSSSGHTFTSAPATNLCASGTATPVSGSGPWAWSCNGSNGGTSESCSANVKAYTLTVAKSGTGTGTVASNPAGINCGASCTAPILPGDAVTLTATEAPGSTFISWSGCEGAVGNICSVTINGTKSITAVFDDITAPDTSITSSPPLQSTSTSFSFSFSSSEAGSTFQCSTNGGMNWGGCVNPYADSVTYTQCTTCRAESSHSFGVRAVDAASNTDSTPAAYAWTINYDLGTVFDNVQAGGTVQLRASVEQSGPFVLSRPVDFVLKGGYDDTYASADGTTSIRGSITISGGTVTFDGIAIL